MNEVEKVLYDREQTQWSGGGSNIVHVKGVRARLKEKARINFIITPTRKRSSRRVGRIRQTESASCLKSDVLLVHLKTALNRREVAAFGV